MTELDAAVLVARWMEAGGATVLFGAPLLLRLAGTPAGLPRGAGALVAGSAAVLAAGTAVALVAQTAAMAGSWREALAPGALAGVVSDTGFGRSVLVRLAAAGAGVAACRWADRKGGRLAAALAGGAALASLAWSGHGAADSGAAGWLHAVGDGLHLLAAGAWLGALAALALLAVQAQRPEATDALAAGLDAFSGVGVAVTAGLAATGLLNVAFLAGPPPWPSAASDPWLLWLALKLGLFAAMLALAALNRWRWRPRLARIEAAQARRALRRSLVLEAALGLAALGAAAAMGGLTPPAARA